MTSNRTAGFTLVELVIVMVISVVLAGVIAQVVSRPMEAYASSAHRARLVDATNVALMRFSSEIRNALPNSVRIGCGGTCIEFLNVVDGGRYRRIAPGDILDFNPSNSDTQFNVLGPLTAPSAVVTGSNASDCRLGSASCLVIYNTGQSGSDAYQLDNIATISSFSAPYTSLSFINTAFSSGNSAFPVDSPQQRFHVVDGPVSYLCDTTAGTIRRYQNYPITGSHTSVDTHAELTALSGTQSAILTDKISACQFDYDPGSPTRSGLVSLTMTLTENLYSGHNESITLLEQVHVSNVP